MKKTLIIVGSSGFFGKSLLSFLENKKDIQKKIGKIYLINRGKSKNIISKKLKKKINFVFIKKNLIKLKKIPNVDYIIYCALLKDLDNDVSALRNFSKILLNNKKKCTIVYTSSGAIYGQKLNKSISTKEREISQFKKDFYSREKGKYALSKIKNEKILKELSKKGFKVRIARCFTFVGKYLPQNKNFLIGRIINTIINKEKKTYKFENIIYRSYLHSDRLSYFLFKLLFLRKNNFEIFNIGSDDSLDFREIIRYLSKKFSFEINFQLLNSLKKKDIYIPNIFKLRKQFNFFKKLSSKNAITKTINELKKI